MAEPTLAAPTATGGYVLRLADVVLDDAARVGGKAATLGNRAHAGFPVPAGFVVTIAAFNRFIADNSFDADPLPATEAGGRIPRGVVDAVRAALGDLTDGAVAVRSSGLAEDRADASFRTAHGEHGVPTMAELVQLDQFRWGGGGRDGERLR